MTRKNIQYKNSGIKWVQQIPEEWEVAKISKYFSLNKNQISKEGLNGKMVYHYSIPSIQTAGEAQLEDGNEIDSNKFVLGGEEILISKLNPRKGTIVISKKHNEVAVASTEFVTLIPKNISIKYGYYLLGSHGVTNHLAGMVQSSTYSHQRVNPDDIYKMRVAIPPLPTQNAIATYLDTKTTQISEFIAKKKQLISLLQEQKQVIIHQAVTKGIDQSAKMKDSGIAWIGQIPEGWEVKKLKYIGNAIIGLTYNPKDITSEGKGTLVLRSSNLKKGLISKDDNVYVSCEIPEKLRTKIGDILICSRNGSIDLVGKNALIDENSQGITFGAFTTVFRSKYYKYLHLFFNSNLFFSQSGLFSTSTINQLTTGILNNMFAPFPPSEDERNKIISYIQSRTSKIDQAITKIEQEISLIEEYGTSLIYHAVTGKIHIN